jgi:hypothetical protein
MKIAFDSTNQNIQKVNLGYYDINFESILCLNLMYLTVPVSTLTTEIMSSSRTYMIQTSDLIKTVEPITLIETTIKYNNSIQTHCSKSTKKCFLSSFLLLLSIFLLLSYIVHFTFYWIFLYLFLKRRDSISIIKTNRNRILFTSNKMFASV